MACIFTFPLCLPPRHTEAQRVLPQLPARQQEPSALAAPGDRNPQEFPRPHISEPSWGSRRPSSRHRVPSAHFAQQPKQTNTRHRCSSDSREIIDLQVAFLALLDAYALAKFITNIYSQLCCDFFFIYLFFLRPVPGGAALGNVGHPGPKLLPLLQRRCCKNHY